MARILFYLLLVLFAINHSIDGYQFSDEPIDVIIPSVEKDLNIINHCIAGIKKNGKGIRRIIVISARRLTDQAEWFDEKNFPFTKEDVALHLFKGDAYKAKAFVSGSKSRVGWYLQQLLKLYAPFVIPGISSNVLCLDSDTVFLKPTSFLNSSNAGLYNYGQEYHQPYFEHAHRLTNGFVKRLEISRSGICHHMVFQRAVLEDLFELVESHHGRPFWEAFCECVDLNELHSSGAAEYEIYFNFVFTKSDQVELRKLKWMNIKKLSIKNTSKRWGFDYVSCHNYL